MANKKKRDWHEPNDVSEFTDEQLDSQRDFLQKELGLGPDGKKSDGTKPFIPHELDQYLWREGARNLANVTKAFLTNFDREGLGYPNSEDTLGGYAVHLLNRAAERDNKNFWEALRDVVNGEQPEKTSFASNMIKRAFGEKMPASRLIMAVEAIHKMANDGLSALDSAGSWLVTRTAANGAEAITGINYSEQFQGAQEKLGYLDLEQTKIGQRLLANMRASVDRMAKDHDLGKDMGNDHGQPAKPGGIAIPPDYMRSKGR